MNARAHRYDSPGANHWERLPTRWKRDQAKWRRAEVRAERLDLLAEVLTAGLFLAPVVTLLSLVALLASAAAPPHATLSEPRRRGPSALSPSLSPLVDEELLAIQRDYWRDRLPMPHIARVELMEKDPDAERKLAEEQQLAREAHDAWPHLCPHGECPYPTK